MRDSFFPFAFDQFKDWSIARGVVIDLQPFARELGDDLLDRGRLVQLDQFAASPRTVRFRHGNVAEGE